MLKTLMKNQKQYPASESEDERSIEESLGLSDESNHNLDEMRDSDIRNAELVIDSHSDDPFVVMRIQTYDDAPMAKGQVSYLLRIVMVSSFHETEDRLFYVPFLLFDNRMKL